MIFTTGDCHGGFQRFSRKHFPQQRQMGRDDCMIILGDFGGVWDGSSEERKQLDWLNEKPFTTLFAALDKLVEADLPQMELYRGIGRLVNSRPEKGAAVAAAEYLQAVYPGSAGFSPRSLRRMRNFYRTYESDPKVMAEATTIGWTQNIVILEVELTLQEKSWYTRAVQQFG